MPRGGYSLTQVNYGTPPEIEPEDYAKSLGY